MITDYIAALRASLIRSIDQVRDATGAGAAADWDDYRYRVGVLTGLRRALQDIEETYCKFVNDED